MQILPTRHAFPGMRTKHAGNAQLGSDLNSLLMVSNVLQDVSWLMIEPNFLYLNVQRGGGDVLQRLGVGLEGRVDPFREELVDLLGCSSDKGRRLEKGVKLGPNGLKVAVLSDPVDQVVLASLFLDNGTGLVRQDPDLLMTFLSISTLLDNGHDDVLGGHKGELLRYPTANDLRVDDHTLGDVLQNDEQGIGGKVCLGNGDTSVGTVKSRQVS